MQIEVHIVNAFIDGTMGGNPAGVVLDADRLSVAQKLRVARAVGLSQTTFVSSSKLAAIRLEYFTPTRQIVHCGHATIAAFALLRRLGRLAAGLSSKETLDGVLNVLIEGEQVFMEQRAPHYMRIDSVSDLGRRVYASLGLVGGADPYVVHTGNAFLILQLPNRRAVADIRPQQAQVELISDELDLIGYYVFSTDTQQPGRDAGARMFAPRYGVAEEAASGMAAGPLACFLHDKLGMAKRSFRIEQGWLMQPPSPSVIDVVLEVGDGGIARLLAGGHARALQVRQVAI